MTDIKNIDEITQQNNANNTDTNSNNENKQNNNTSNQIVLGCDRNGHDDSGYQTTVADILTQSGYTVEKLAIEPNAFASYSYDSSKAKGKIGIYLIAAGTYSIGDATYGNTSFDYNYFGIRPECSPNWDVDDFDTKPIGADADSQGGVTDKIAGKSFKEINEIVKSRSMVVTGKDATEMGNNLVSALGGQTQGGTSVTTTGGGAVSIPDKTFYGLIKQILGAVDGLFIIANNMAYLLSFKDFYEYRDLYDKYIPVIDSRDVLEDSVVRNWTTDGYYNAIEVSYDGGIIKYQNDALVQQYGENIFYYDFPNDDEETAKAKADALLAAHIRDYSTEIQLSVFYNENITAGSWVKLHKSLSQLSGKTHREVLQEQQNTKRKISTKHKGIDITNLTEKTIKQDDKTKIIQTITDKKGDTFDIEIDKSEYELFFIQSFTCRWDKDNALIMDLILKYGPDTPEDPVNATIGTGETVSTTGSGGGQYGNDCFTIDDICVANNAKIYGHYSGGASVEAVKSLVNGKHSPESSDYQPRANQNSNYNKKYGSLTAPEVYSNFRSEYRYSLYADNCSCWKCATDFYDNAGKTANCGDSTCLLKVFYDCIGVPSCGIHIDGHYFNAIQINGTWEIIDGVRNDNQTCNFPDGTGYCFGNPYPCDSYKGATNE